MSHDLFDPVRRMIDAWNRGDVDEFVAVAHPDAQWRPASSLALAGGQGSYIGPEGIRSWWREMHEAFDDLHNDIEEMHLITPTAALIVGTLRGRGRAGGVPVAQPFGMLLEFRDGLFVRGRSWFDRQEAFAAAAALAESHDPS